MFGLFSKKKPMIGRLESVDLPELGIFGIQAKVDTGAYRSSIHARDIYEAHTSKGTVLSFKLLDEEHPQYNGHTYTVTKFSRVRVKSSFGEAQHRYKIKTAITIRSRKFVADFTLSDRAAMRHPLLLGRKALRNRFVVDVSKS